jgi:N-methylhydantoinase B
MYIRRGEDVTPARTHRMVQIRTGEVLGKVSGGGGGVGDPLERDPSAVLEDVIDEMTSVGYAREVYGVAIVPGDPPTLDAAETARLRAAARASRVAAGAASA